VVELAELPEGQRISTAYVAKKQNIPLPFLAKIVTQLVVRDILTSTRGVNGGVNLARDPATITMLEIIEAIDGPVTMNRCTRDPEVCAYSDTCPLCEVFIDIQQNVVQKFRGITILELAERAQNMIVLA
jgi:Rrf2 family protein